MPVTGSSFCFSWVMVQEGVMRRSEEADGEVMSIGTSRAVSMIRVNRKGGDYCCRRLTGGREKAEGGRGGV